MCTPPVTQSKLTQLRPLLTLFLPWLLRWRNWETLLPSTDLSKDAEFADIIVPTVSTAQFDFIAEMMIRKRKKLLVCGPTGVGKSAYMKRMLLRTLPSAEFQPIFVAFSAQTTAAQTQSIVDQKLEKRRKGVFGPRLGMQCLVFVDDMNLPAVEKYGAQPPIELLRQFCDHGGWYDLAENTFKTFEDTFMLGAMLPPGGGANNISPRMLRHMNMLSFTEFNDSTLSRIFGTIMHWFLTKKQDFGPDIVKLESVIVAATAEVYKSAIAHLRPTPTKSHYTFNLRDFSRVIQGICLTTPAEVETPEVGSLLGPRRSATLIEFFTLCAEFRAVVATRSDEGVQRSSG